MTHPSILVLEDNAVTLKLLEQLLTAQEIPFATAENGREGMQLFEQQSFDIVLTDIFMPEQDGLETINLLRQTGKPSKIIAMSSGIESGDEDFLKEAKAAGADAVITKPIVKDKLLQAIAEVMGNASPASRGHQNPAPTQKAIICMHPQKTVLRTIKYFFNNAKQLEPFNLSVTTSLEELLELLSTLKPWALILDPATCTQEKRQELQSYAASQQPPMHIITILPSGDPPHRRLPDWVGAPMLNRPLVEDEMVKIVLNLG